VSATSRFSLQLIITHTKFLSRRCTASITTKLLEEYKEMVRNLKYDLRELLRDIDEKLAAPRVMSIIQALKKTTPRLSSQNFPRRVTLSLHSLIVKTNLLLNLLPSNFALRNSTRENQVKL
jgi:hypothetical protein